MPERCDIAVVGTGAAGLMAAVSAARAGPGPLRIVALDSAQRLGAKILVAGGGRCNVTHHHVDHHAYAGSSPNAIRKVLARFDVPATVAFFRELGVELKREETGKLFPVSDDAHTVLDALLSEARRRGVELRHPWRVHAITQRDGGLLLSRSATVPGDADSAPSRDELLADRVILATGGMALPRSGSDGHGYTLASALGHSTTPAIFPALVPLRLADGHYTRALSGLAAPATLHVVAGSGKRFASFTNSTLCTHFGLSGPGPLDISRHLAAARAADAGASLVVNWLPAFSPETLDAHLLSTPTRSPLRVLRDAPCSLPERLAQALCDHARLGPLAVAPVSNLPRDARRALVATVTSDSLPVVGDRGFTHAEVTAGGIPLDQVRLESMQSRLCERLHLAGEILDVDGRIGGFNFQWAWASGHVAGTAAALASLRAAGL